MMVTEKPTSYIFLEALVYAGCIPSIVDTFHEIVTYIKVICNIFTVFGELSIDIR